MSTTVQTSSSTPNYIPCTSPTNNTLPQSNFLKRLSEWFWPVLTYEVDHFESHNSIVSVTGAPVDSDSFYHKAGNSTTTRKTSNHIQPPRLETISEVQEQPHANHREKASVSCKACRVEGKVCDREQPWCSECLDQQILCFYVSPLSTTRKNRKPKKESMTVKPQIAVPTIEVHPPICS